MTWTAQTEQSSNWASLDKLIVPGVTFNGSSGLLEQNSTLGADSNKLTYSFWFKFDSFEREANGNVQRVFNASSRGLFSLGNVLTQVNGGLNYTWNTPGVTFAFQFLADAFTDTEDWHHTALSVDLSDSSKRHVLLDGAASSGTWSHYNDVDMGFDLEQPTVSSRYNLTVAYGHFGGGVVFGMEGSLAQLWLMPGVYMTEAELISNFRDGVQPADLGDRGQNPAGSVPPIYMPMNTEDFGENLGSLPDMETVGTVVQSENSPAADWVGQTEVISSSSKASESFAPGALFKAQFESGDFSEFDDTSNAVDLGVTAAAALSGDFGMLINLAGTDENADYVSKTFGALTNDTFHVYYKFRANTTTSAEGSVVQNSSTIQLRNSLGDRVFTIGWLNSHYPRGRIQFFVFNDTSVQSGAPRITAPSEWLDANTTYEIEARIEYASSASASDGQVTIWVDGAQYFQLSGIDIFDKPKPSLIRVGAAQVGAKQFLTGVAHCDDVALQEGTKFIGRFWSAQAEATSSWT